MNDKLKPRKKKVPSAAARPTRQSARASVKPAAKKAAFYVTVPPNSVVIVADEKPVGGGESKSFATFAKARAAAIDALLVAIEESERQLLALKRAGSYEELK